MAALAIMAHGDEKGNILDVDGDTLSVQSLVDEMREVLPNTPMVCIYNEHNKSWKFL